MIKINLLLARKEKRKVGIKKELISLIAAVVFLFLILGAFHWKIYQNREETAALISKTKNEIAHFKSLTTEVNRAKEDNGSSKRN